MADYIPSLEKVQIGLEAVWADLAAPTVQLVGITDCRITPHVEAAQITDKRGTTMPAYIASVNKLWGEAEVSGAVAIRSFNLVHGQPDVTFSLGGAIVDNLKISGPTNGPLTFTAHLVGKGVVDDALEVLTDDAVVLAMGHHCQLYIDPIAGPIGTTEIISTAFSFEANIAVDRKLVWHLGSLNPDSFRPGKWGGGLRLVVEMTSDMQDILNAALGQEVSPGAYAVRIKATDKLGTSILTLDHAGHLLTAPALFTDNDGVTTVELDFAPVFSSDATFLSCWGANLVLP